MQCTLWAMHSSVQRYRRIPAPRLPARLSSSRCTSLQHPPPPPPTHPPAPATTRSCASARFPRHNALLRGEWQPSTPRQEMLGEAPRSSRRRAMCSTEAASKGEQTAAWSGKSSAPPNGVCTGLQAGDNQGGALPGMVSSKQDMGRSSHPSSDPPAPSMRRDAAGRRTCCRPASRPSGGRAHEALLLLRRNHPQPERW